VRLDKRQAAKEALKVPLLADKKLYSRDDRPPVSSATSLRATRGESLDGHVDNESNATG